MLQWMLESIISLVSGSEKLGLFIIFLLLLACGLGLPIPEDISIVASGILVSGKLVTFWHAFLVCMVGIIIGDSMIYWMGRLWGKKLFKKPLISKVINNRFLSIGRLAFKKFGKRIIFFARFMPGLRAPIYFFAGSRKISFIFFLIVDGIAASISVPVWIYVGKIFGENLDVLDKAIKKMQLGTVMFVILIILLLIAGNYLKKRFTKMLGKRI